MHVDSRNPTLYTPKIYAENAFCDTFTFDYLYMMDIKAYDLRGIQAEMFIDECDVETEQYVDYEDYKSLKAKLENLERKHAKLKRRHANLGSRYLVVKQKRDYLIKEYTNHSEMDYT